MGLESVGRRDWVLSPAASGDPAYASHVPSVLAGGGEVNSKRLIAQTTLRPLLWLVSYGGEPVGTSPAVSHPPMSSLLTSGAWGRLHVLQRVWVKRVRAPVTQREQL
jgi:hypothetical protein